MNNDQFRKLVLANAEKTSGKKHASSTPNDRRVGTGSLGSRERNSIPMTPRSVASSQSMFSNQAAHPHKKFKTSAPKGVKLASGYVDRARDRQDASIDDRGERLAALEKSFQAGQIDKAAYDKLRFEIAGGSLDTTHLVKGLDFKLLERIRRGEDIHGKKSNNDANEDDDDAVDRSIDNALDEIEQSEVIAIERDKTVKKTGQLATVPVPGQKRTRDQILAELKASREAAKAQKESSLGNKFRKIGSKQKPGTRIERDGKGREVLIIIDEDGREKRKVRKMQSQEGENEPGHGLLMPDPKVKPLGMEVPEQYRQKPEPTEDLDGDIFEGVGDDYDPLADLDVSESSSESESDADADPKRLVTSKPSPAADEETNKEAALMPPPPTTETRRNYFEGSKTGLMSEETAQGPSASDPALMAAIKRAATLRRIEEESDKDEVQAETKTMEERRRKLEQMRERDDDDLDMGFGTSRFEDEEDSEDRPVKLSMWGDGGDEKQSGRGGQSKRKRGPKKRKGDGNNAADVLRVMEQRKQS